ncbi:YceI family protein [Flavobacterium sp. N2270]|uniref:YceI family protein n=1 Tax=Flavobacterium sp. N2270 TaxID=2986831 RepID=UPI0022252ED0|nr:YceI family protein [Flavobacterium sp. N2270]
MKKSILSLFVLATISLNVSCKGEKNDSEEAGEVATASIESTNYTVDTQNSVIEWTGSKPSGKHNGTINLKSGELAVKNDTIESGMFVIDMNSIVVSDLAAGDGKEDLEAHLKGTGDKAGEDHFFNVTKFPEGTFEIVSITAENGKAKINGNLTLKGVTKPVEFTATTTNNGDEMTLTSDAFLINRTHWNVNYASKSIFDDLKDKFVNDDIELVVKLKATKK